MLLYLILTSSLLNFFSLFLSSPSFSLSISEFLLSLSCIATHIDLGVTHNKPQMHPVYSGASIASSRNKYANSMTGAIQVLMKQFNYCLQLPRFGLRRSFPFLLLLLLLLLLG